MKRKYINKFKFVGLSRLDHCEGEDWTEVWKDPMWNTKILPARRAAYLWKQMRRERPDIEPLYDNPVFIPGRRYILGIRRDEIGQTVWLFPYLVEKGTVKKL